ncbi:MAG: hypothetical protein Q4F49_02760 [Pseudoxanthomonas suwonensis]|nr:hypothetical protein [Pseudoxanthomonas suwonensis]
MNPSNDTESRFTRLLRENPQLNDEATVEGITALIEKITPLVQGGRMHNVVDLLSALSDVVDLADEGIVQKLSKDFEDMTALAFNGSNCLNHALDVAGRDEQGPSVWQAIGRINRDDDARRGLGVALAILAQLGRQARYGAMPMPED